mgnify:CR=1 FL=1
MNATAMRMQIPVRRTSDGQYVGLKNPSQNARVSSHRPGVSMYVMMPLMTTNDM